MSANSKTIRVLVIDDSAVMRRLITEMLNSDPQIEVVDTAMDPYAAREKIKRLDPDVITLDIEMPKMDGLTFLANLMRLRPMPVIMFSSLTKKHADETMRALELGAVNFVCKPSGDLPESIDAVASELVERVKEAASANMKAVRASRPKTETRREIEQRYSADEVIKRDTSARRVRSRHPVIAIGASTGGVEALISTLAMMPADTPPIVITQHIPAAFSSSFAARANNNSAMTVHHAEDGMQLEHGNAYIAPGAAHLLVVNRGGKLFTELSDGPPVNRHKPSVDVLFRSVAQSVGASAMGVLLTGMGDDGARGLKELQETGCLTIAQDEVSSVVWGMPGSAVKMGAADEQVSLPDVPDRIMQWYHDK